MLRRMHDNQSFTLIELLIVVAIIGILAALIIVSLNTILPRARDAQRKAALNEIQKALAEFYINHGYYPGEQSFPPPTGGWWENISNTAYGAEMYNDMLSYMSSVPQDPLYGKTSEDYMYVSGNIGSAVSLNPGTYQHYWIGAHMELSSDYTATTATVSSGLYPTGPNPATFNYIIQQ